MAETYSQEFQNIWITKPPVRTEHMGVPMRVIPFTYTQVLAGTAADTVVLASLPPLSMLLLPSSVIYVAGLTASLTLSVGWKAYTDVYGVVQAASATGLFNAADVGSATAILHGGMQAQATPDDELPVVGAIMKDFHNRTYVDIFATFNAQVPGAAAVVNGYFTYLNLA